MVAACSSGSGEPADSRPAASGEFAGTIRLGAALSETGKYSVEGRDSRQGYDTWLTWVNETYGGIRIGDQRYRAEIVYYDDESDADTANSLTQRLIDDDQVDFLLGPYSSSLTSGTSAIAEANNVLMVEGNGTSDAMFERGKLWEAHRVMREREYYHIENLINLDRIPEPTGFIFSALPIKLRGATAAPVRAVAIIND